MSRQGSRGDLHSYICGTLTSQRAMMRQSPAPLRAPFRLRARLGASQRTPAHHPSLPGPNRWPAAPTRSLGASDRLFTLRSSRAVRPNAPLQRLRPRVSFRGLEETLTLISTQRHRNGGGDVQLPLAVDEPDVPSVRHKGDNLRRPHFAMLLQCSDTVARQNTNRQTERPLLLLVSGGGEAPTQAPRRGWRTRALRALGQSLRRGRPRARTPA